MQHLPPNNTINDATYIRLLKRCCFLKLPIRHRLTQHINFICWSRESQSLLLLRFLIQKIGLLTLPPKHTSWVIRLLCSYFFSCYSFNFLSRSNKSITSGIREVDPLMGDYTKSTLYQKNI